MVSCRSADLQRPCLFLLSDVQYDAVCACSKGPSGPFAKSAKSKSPAEVVLLAVARFPFRRMYDNAWGGARGHRTVSNFDPGAALTAEPIAPACPAATANHVLLRSMPAAL